jgi:tetratricopeptide (TPR) repeat protein
MEIFFSNKANLISVGSKQTAPLVNYFPCSSNGLTLITTRDKRVGERLANREKAITVLPMTKLEAERLLWSRVAEEGSLDKTKSSELLEVLGYLPLAITQAAAYISENNITVEEYVEAICAEDSEIQDLLTEDLPDLRRDFESQSSVIRTWKVSFDQIRKQKPRAAEILSLMAVLDQQGIPKMLLYKDGERGIEFTTALGMLQAFSLVTVEKGGANLEIHRLVQVSIQRWLELQSEIAKWQEEALKVLTAAFPSGNYGTWITCKALSPHAQAVTRYTFTSNVNLLQCAELLKNMSSYDQEQGQYNLAYERSLGALSTRERVLGPEHPDTLTSMNNLAVVLRDQGKYKAAKKMHRRALELREKVLGPEHPSTLASMNNLAEVLRGQGKYEAAEKMHQQALELWEKVLGPEHPSTLTSMNNLAVVLRGQGKYKAAEEMHRRALELCEKVLGPEHPYTLASMNNLAKVLGGQGKYEAAEKMHRRALEL